jgi:hypothetical protein
MYVKYFGRIYRTYGHLQGIQMALAHLIYIHSRVLKVAGLDLAIGCVCFLNRLHNDVPRAHMHA